MEDGGLSAESEDDVENVEQEMESLGKDSKYANEPDDIVMKGSAFHQARKKRLKKQPWILSINDPKKTHWDLFIMILATINCFQIPFDVAFQPELFQSIWF